jgi:hypothetical protein
MTVSSTNRVAGPFLGNGVTDTFPFAFKVFTESDVVVVSADAYGAETTLTINTDYTVSLNANQDSSPGGDVVLSAPLVTGLTLVITSDVPKTQNANITNAGGFYPAVINAALDRLAISAQELSEQVSRAVKLPITSGESPDDIVAALNNSASSAASSAAAAAAAAAATADDRLQTSDDRTQTGIDAANASNSAAVAAAATRIYATTAAGLAATVSTQYFYIPSAVAAGFLDLYLNSTGTAVFQKTYPSDVQVNANTGAIIALQSRAANLWPYKNYEGSLQATLEGSPAMFILPARDSSGNLYNLFALLADGSIESLPLSNFVAGKLTAINSRLAELTPYKSPSGSSDAYLDGITPSGGHLAMRGADGLLYSVLSVLPDGSLDSLPLANFVDGRNGGIKTKTVGADGWGEYVVAKRGADGLLYAVFGVLSDNTFYGQNISGGGADKLIHIPLLGQSNMAADQSTPPLSTAATGWGNYRFTRGVQTWISTDNPTTPASRAASDFALVGLTAGAVETRANGLADAYKALVKAASRYSPDDQTGSPHMLMSFSGIGSRRLTDLGPVDSGATDAGNTHAAPGGYWPTMMDDIARAKAQAATLGFGYSVPCWFYDQGEREGDGKLYETGSVLANSALISGYESLAISMASTFDSTVRGLTGQTRPIPLLVTPASSNLLTPTAWQDVADASALVYIVGPRYHMPSALNASSGSGGSQVWGADIHYSPDGHRWMGELCAKVMHRLLNRGEKWQPLRALSASKVDGTTVDVVFNVPRPPLVIDTTFLAKAKGWGFSVYGGTIDSPTGRIYATGIEIQPDGSTIRLTFGSGIPASAKLAIGYASQCDLGSNPAVTAVGTGANTADGFATYTLTVDGDITGMLTPLTNEGAFYVYGGNPSHGVIRGVAYSGGNTILTGETRELRSDGSYVPFTVGDTLTFGRPGLYTNLRDSDPALAVNTFASGPKAGQLYPLQNWACLYDSMTIIGA